MKHIKSSKWIFTTFSYALESITIGKTLILWIKRINVRFIISSKVLRKCYAKPWGTKYITGMKNVSFLRLLSNDSIICYGSFDFFFLYKNAVQHPKRHMLLTACVTVLFMTAGYKKMPVKTQNVKQKFSNKSISL